MEENHKELIAERRKRVKKKKGKETTGEALEEERRVQSMLFGGNGEQGRDKEESEKNGASNKQHKHAILNNKFF